MPDTVPTITLPRKVQDVLDEIERIQKKIAALQKLGGDTAGTENFFQVALKRITTQLAAEARAEIVAAEAAAERLNAPPPEQLPHARDPGVAANDDIERLEAIEKERARIREKLKHARRHTPAGEPTDLEDDAEADLAAMDKKIRRAARDAARREMRDLDREIEDIARGRPRRNHRGPAGNPPPPPPPPPPDDKKDADADDDKKGGGGSSGGGGSASGDPGTIDVGTVETEKGDTVGKRKEGNKEPAIPTIYVRNETKIWTWNARELVWLEMDFGAELVEVQTITGGLLAFSATRAALYDSYLGEWLPQLDVPGGVLNEAKAA